MEKEKIDYLYQQLKVVVDSNNIFINEPMKKHTSFKVGGNADIFIKIQTREELKRSFASYKKGECSFFNNRQWK